MPSDSRTNTLGKPHKHLRITVVGDGTTGKTCLLICYKDKRFEGYYIPTVLMYCRTKATTLRSTEGVICRRLKNLRVRNSDSFTMNVDEGLTDILEGLTSFDSYSMTVPIGDEEYTIILSDTAGQEEYDRLRPLAYPDTDVFIICFAVDNRASMKNVERKWVPEIRHHKPHAKIILVCTKYDLASLTTIQRHEGEALERKFKLDGFVECSSKEMYNVNKVFADAISTLLTPPKKSKKPKQMCTLL